jgi:hypothetical protein
MKEMISRMNWQDKLQASGKPNPYRPCTNMKNCVSGC